MAVYPCDVGSHRYAGPQRSVYITSCFGRDTETVKLRLCLRHFTEIELAAAADMEELGEDDVQSGLSCACGADRDYIVFAKMFDQSAEPREYAADLCAAHRYDLLAKLSAGSGRPL